MKRHFYAVLAISSILFCVSCNFADSLVANYHYSLGSSKRKSGNLEEAILEYSKAIQSNKKHHKAYASRGSTYFDLKDYPSAINDYSKAIHLDPKNAEVYTYRGRTYYECDSIELALADYNKAIQLKDKLAIAYYQRGLLRFTNKDLIGGCQDFKKAADLGDEESAETVKKYCNEFL
ncbi:tetratricopeptide repeat protein [Sphingobacterium phlebotomi]|uniref:Tetratricopeptide repeat protein n=1 Tax=Sphingobacterium phlebotomi TaxID=2605433 RepID=A0A5D4GT20_9SPHI|nr:tetratricopeptide repeat protein [Sphingobacterium phlebotomi]TYR31202.1 tetratricopeptide repeat protein [Sphingobacterium phlebotomi]